jgi:hypothetical protein
LLENKVSRSAKQGKLGQSPTVLDLRFEPQPWQ